MGQLLVIVTTLMCIAFLFLITPCVALHVHVPNLTSSPRKLMAIQKQALKTGNNEIVPEKKAKEAVIGGNMQPNKEVKMKPKKEETFEKWDEEVNEPSDLFTMDYRRVRRRQPIHNKSLPIP